MLIMRTTGREWRALQAYTVDTVYLLGLSSHDDDDDDDDDEIAYFAVRWKTRASFVYRTKNMR